jgi:hypothetical protein
MKRISVFIILPMLLTACGGGTELALAGPCIHNLLEPILLIDSATVTGSALAIETISLETISIDGVTPDLIVLASGSKGIQVSGPTLTCKTPCGFGGTQGNYSMRVQAAGFRPLQLSAAARYATLIGGCPSSSTGGTHINVVLEPQ